jgi:outer membrane protein OmpA-like peptidoglycan-associated protein
MMWRTISIALSILISAAAVRDSRAQQGSATASPQASSSSSSASSSASSSSSPDMRQLQAKSGTLRLISATEADLDGAPDASGKPTKLIFVINPSTRCDAAAKAGETVNVIYLADGSRNIAIRIELNLPAKPLHPVTAGGVAQATPASRSAFPSHSHLPDTAAATSGSATGSASAATGSKSGGSAIAGSSVEASLEAIFGPQPHHVGNLNDTVANFDRYTIVTDANVKFGFGNATLTMADREQLDGLASHLKSTNTYIIKVTGGDDSAGDSHLLNLRREDVVVNYLSATHNISPRKFYLITGDKEKPSNKTAEGRSAEHPIEVTLLSADVSPASSGEATNPAPGNNSAPAAAKPPTSAVSNAAAAAASPGPEPAKIEKGQSMGAVVRALGQPDKIVTIGNKTIFVYKDVKVTFVDDLVTNLE